MIGLSHGAFFRLISGEKKVIAKIVFNTYL